MASFIDTVIGTFSGVRPQTPTVRDPSVTTKMLRPFGPRHSSSTTELRSTGAEVEVEVAFVLRRSSRRSHSIMTLSRRPPMDSAPSLRLAKTVVVGIEAGIEDGLPIRKGRRPHPDAWPGRRSAEERCQRRVQDPVELVGVLEHRKVADTSEDDGLDAVPA